MMYSVLHTLNLISFWDIERGALLIWPKRKTPYFRARKLGLKGLMKAPPVPY